MNQEQQQIFESFVQEALQQTLPQCELTRLQDTYQGELVNWPDSVCVSIMGFQGERMHGTAVLGCDFGFLERTCPAYQIGGSDKDLLLHDWIGELSNLILGRIKNKLMPLGIVLKLNPPSVTEASEAIFETYSTQPHNVRLWFTSEEDFLCIAFSMELAESVQFSAHPSTDGHALQPGDAIYRLNEPTGSSKKYDVVSQIRSGVSIDEDSLGQDDFDLGDEGTLNSPGAVLPGSWERVSTSSPSTAQVSSPPFVVPASSFRTTAPEPVDASQRRVLEAVSWRESGELHLRFQGGLTYSLTLEMLVRQGWSVLIIEGYHFELTLNEESVRVLVPELQMTLERNPAAA